jgi:hypothetical protein
VSDQGTVLELSVFRSTLFVSRTGARRGGPAAVVARYVDPIGALGLRSPPALASGADPRHAGRVNTSSLRRRLGLGALLATLALLVAGCMRIDMALTLNEDDTVDGSAVMAISDEVARAAGQDPQALWDQLGGQMESGLPPGATQEPYAEDGYTGTRLTYTDQPISQMSSTGGTDPLSITREGDDFVVSGEMDLSDEELGIDGTDPQSDEMTRQMMEGFDVRISVTFPGEVGETNGEVDGSTVTWTPVLGEVTEISARGSAVAGGAAAPDEETGDGSDEGATDPDATDLDDAAAFPWWLLGIVAGLVLLGIVGLVLWLVLRKKPSDQGGPGSQQGVYAGAPGPYGVPGQAPGPGYPGQQGGQHPGAPQPYPGQPYPGGPAGPQGQYAPPPAAPYGGAPGPQGAPGPYAPAQPAQGQPGQAGQPHPQPAPTTPLAPQQPAPTQPLPPAGTAPGAPTQPPTPGQPDAGRTDAGPDDEIDDATHLRPPQG